jgi:hypothetical protein
MRQVALMCTGGPMPSCVQEGLCPHRDHTISVLDGGSVPPYINFVNKEIALEEIHLLSCSSPLTNAAGRHGCHLRVIRHTHTHTHMHVHTGMHEGACRPSWTHEGRCPHEGICPHREMAGSVFDGGSAPISPFGGSMQ